MTPPDRAAARGGDPRIDVVTDAATDAIIDVAIVGGGPVGLALALHLTLRGVEVRVFEARAEPRRHSRAIGIHPTALETLAPLGVVDALRAEGAEVRRGHAFAAGGGRTRALGTLDFGLCPPPYRFVLTLPQRRTEAILAARLAELAPGALLRERRVTGLERGAGGVVLAVDGPGGPTRWRAAAAVGCDGRDSAVRALLGIAVDARAYDDAFAMGDFADPAGSPDAGIYLTPGGVVEAFPLPGGVRRWVVATRRRVDDPDPAWLCAEIRRRTGARVDPASCTMRSSFGVERRLAARFTAGRVALCGDAAHVCSPIGGQGMNLGWLDAAALAGPLAALARDPAAAPAEPFTPWARRRRRAARAAVRRAELNMALGRPWRWPALRAALVGAALRRPFADGAARLFTMRGLAG